MRDLNDRTLLFTRRVHSDNTAIIAVGRDAYDIAFLDSQAPAELLWQSVEVKAV